MAPIRLALPWLLSALVAMPAHADISIGVAAPLTGPLFFAGEQTVNGASLGVDQLNAKGGVLGQKLVVEVVDDFCDGQQAVAAADKLVAARVAVVIGHECSGAAIPASEVYERAGIIMISPGATNPNFTERGLKNVFRVVGRDDEQGIMAADYILDKLAGKPIAIVHDGRTYGEGLADEVRRHLHERGVREAVSTKVAPGQLDFGALVDELAGNGIGVLYYAGYSKEAGLLIRQAKERLPNLQVIVPDGVAVHALGIVAGPALDGTLMTNVPDERWMPTAADALRTFKEAGYEPPGAAGAANVRAYAAVQIWTQAVEAAGTTAFTEVEKVLRSREFATPLGSLRFDAKGDVVGIETFWWYVWRNGDYTPLDVRHGL